MGPPVFPQPTTRSSALLDTQNQEREVREGAVRATPSLGQGSSSGSPVRRPPLPGITSEGTRASSPIQGHFLLAQRCIPRPPRIVVVEFNVVHSTPPASLGDTLRAGPLDWSWWRQDKIVAGRG